MITSHFIDKLGKENVYLSIEEAIENCKFSTSKPKKTINESGDSSKDAEDASDDASQQVWCCCLGLLFCNWYAT